MAHSLNVDNITVPDIRTKRDNALRVLRAGAIVTTIGASFIALGGTLSLPTAEMNSGKESTTEHTEDAEKDKN
jgi:hypothetical protein